MFLTDPKRWPKKLGQTWSRPIFNLVRSPRFFPTGSEKSSPSSPPEAARLVAASTASSFFDVFKMFRQKKRAERNFVTSFQSIVFWKSIFCFLFFVGTFSGADFGFLMLCWPQCVFFLRPFYGSSRPLRGPPRGASRPLGDVRICRTFFLLFFFLFFFFFSTRLRLRPPRLRIQILKVQIVKVQILKVQIVKVQFLTVQIVIGQFNSWKLECLICENSNAELVKNMKI